MIPAVFLDLVRCQPLLVKGAGTGFLWSLLLFGFSSYFFDPQFQYTTAETGIAIVSGAIGGLGAGAIISLFRQWDTRMTIRS